MNKWIKVLLALIAFVFIGGILWIVESFVGNPISKILAERRANQYIKTNYSEMELEVSKVFYNFKDGCYHAYIESPTSIDTYFTIDISRRGKIRYDSYEGSVVKRWNTYDRIDKAYRSMVEDVFESVDFPYESDIDFGELKIKEEPQQNDYMGPVYGLDIESLELDKAYNIKGLGQNVGHIIFYTEDEEISVERAAEMLLDIKDILDKKEVPFYAIDFVLQKPRNEDEKRMSEDEIRVNDFLYSDIYKEGLEQRIEEADQLVKAYYKAQDEMKKEEEAQYKASVGKNN